MTVCSRSVRRAIPGAVFLLATGTAMLAGGTFSKEGSFPPMAGAIVSSPLRYEGPQPFDVLHYRLDLTLGMTDESLGGTMTMTMRLKEPVDSIRLNALRLTISSVLVDGLTVGFTPIDTLAESFTVLLGSIHPAGDTLTIAIAYSRPPSSRSRRGYYYFRDLAGLPAPVGYTFSEPSDARLWMPCYDEPWEKATAEMHLTVPTGFVAASNGRLIGTTDNGNGTTTWSWREDHQIATYLMCITSSAFSVATLPFVRGVNDTVPLQYVVWREDSAQTAAFLPTVREMMARFSSTFGPFAFDKYGMTGVVPFGYLGMEHQTLTTLTRAALTWPRVVAHEMAHQWWGDLVTCGTWADVWLNESFATYGEALWYEHLGGPTGLQHYMKDTLELFQYGSWQGALYDPVGQGFNLFDQVVYSKGGWVLHTLRGVVGDSTFFDILKAYRARFSYASAVTDEFKQVVDSVTGSDMSWFFNQWVYGSGWPKYASSWTWTQDTLQLTVYQQQSALWPTFRMPMEIGIYTNGAETRFTIFDSLRIQQCHLAVSSAPDSVVLDPDRWILKQILPPPASVGEEELPLAFSLLPNYPNPFNPTTTIEFVVPERAFVTLAVYDLLGRRVATLVDGQRQAGRYIVTWNAGENASGVYFARLSDGTSSAIRRMLLLR